MSVFLNFLVYCLFFYHNCIDVFSFVLVVLLIAYLYFDPYFFLSVFRSFFLYSLMFYFFLLSLFHDLLLCCFVSLFICCLFLCVFVSVFLCFCVSLFLCFISFFLSLSLPCCNKGLSGVERSCR